MPSDETHKLYDTLKNQSHEQSRQVKLLDNSEQYNPMRSRRRSPRLPVAEQLNCTFSYADKLERDIWFKAGLRNISNHGVGLLHGAYIHTGSAAVVHLHTPDGETLAISGVVRRCTFVSGRTHDIGIEFDAPIDASSLLSQ